MIAHVAQAGEARGRVVLQLCSGNASSLAIEAAICVAQAFQAEIESLFVEDQQLFELASFPFAREISRTGRRSRAISTSDIEREMKLVFAALQRRIEAMARAADVPIRQRVVRDVPVKALAEACAECGPWNVVALAEPFAPSACHSLQQLLATVSDTTGLVVVGPKAQRTTGPVIAAVEDVERLSAMMHAAERLATVARGDIIVFLIAEGEEHLHWMEGQVRLLLGERANVRVALAEIAHGASAVVAEALRRQKGGFVISQFGGLVVPSEGDLKPLAAALECPLFLVR
jgi:hypothetical protein